MTRSVERTYHHQPIGHDRWQVWFIETITTRTLLDTGKGIDGALHIEDTHKHEHEDDQ